MKDKHVHTHQLKIRRIRADNVNYHGTTGDKAFILNVCKCGHEKAIDYGEVGLIALRFRELTNVQAKNLSPLS